MALPILHIFSAVLNTFILWYDQKYVNVVFKDGLDGYPFKNRIIFLTIWNLVLQTIYMWIAFINDLIGTNEPSPRKPPLIRQLKDNLFVVAFPLGVYVSLAFWGVYSVDKKLIFPEHLAKAYPPWINHTLHTLVSVFITIEMFTSHITYPRRKLGLALINLCTFSYIIWILIVYCQTYVWVYPVLDRMNWPARICFIGGSIAFGNAFYLFGEKLNKMLKSPSNVNAKKKVK